MDSHSKTYEQYCWVKQRNIVMRETVYHNGKRRVVCTNLSECNALGGCQNKNLCMLWKNEAIQDNNHKNADCE